MKHFKYFFLKFICIFTKDSKNIFIKNSFIQLKSTFYLHGKPSYTAHGRDEIKYEIIKLNNGEFTLHLQKRQMAACFFYSCRHRNLLKMDDDNGADITIVFEVPKYDSEAGISFIQDSHRSTKLYSDYQTNYLGFGRP